MPKPVEPTKAPAPAKPFTFGMILVGPQNDKGWSQANYDAGQYVEQKLGAKMIVIDKVNTADRPGTTVDQVAADMIAQGAQMVFATSDDMKDGALLAAEKNPTVPMVWASGDSAWKDGKAYAPQPDQPGQHHGQDGIRQDDGRLRRRVDDGQRLDRLSWPADQRRNPPPGGVNVPGRALLLGEAIAASPPPA